MTNLNEFENLSLSSFIHGRAYHSVRGHEDIDTEIPKLDELVAVIGGRHTTREIIKRRLTYPTGLRTWGIFDRVQYDPKLGWSYCAGQSYTEELAVIRKLIRNQ